MKKSELRQIIREELHVLKESVIDKTVVSIEPEYISKLRKLKVYDKWLVNFKKQYADWMNEWREEHLIDARTWYSFINWSFDADSTVEGKSFWDNIARK